MSNFIFISPDFPNININLCENLSASGLQVLGIGDADFDGLDHRLKESLTEYYRVGSLENEDEVYRAVAFLAFKYGKPDRLDSNNSYWLSQDAQLRLNFNIPGINWGASDADCLEIVKEAGLPVGEPAGEIFSWDAFIGNDRDVLFEGVTQWPSQSATEYTYRTVTPIPPLLRKLGKAATESLRARLTFLHIPGRFPTGSNPQDHPCIPLSTSRFHFGYAQLRARTQRLPGVCFRVCLPRPTPGPTGPQARLHHQDRGLCVPAGPGHLRMFVTRAGVKVGREVAHGGTEPRSIPAGHG
ncbi:hypothetical protein [Flaviflexus massiliensis]|uniref:hypothetical protein n=1 Tax=Flaviflexus massiliensis TaxID=1522309 RepID=UPI0006D54304|nr:hypothetical protein [Flaviflexus massiliensis]